ncbi:MAG: FmdB family zinc ribbon protein [Candidatus Acidiferrales bacterium]
MPIYEYVCEDCTTRFERVVMSKNGKPECPKCGSRKAAMQFSVFAAHGGNGSSTSNRGAGDSAPAASSCACTPRGCGCH